MLDCGQFEDNVRIRLSVGAEKTGWSNTSSVGSSPCRWAMTQVTSSMGCGSLHGFCDVSLISFRGRRIPVMTDQKRPS